MLERWLGARPARAAPTAACTARRSRLSQAQGEALVAQLGSRVGAAHAQTLDHLLVYDAAAEGLEVGGLC